MASPKSTNRENTMLNVDQITAAQKEQLESLFEMLG